MSRRRASLHARALIKQHERVRPMSAGHVERSNDSDRPTEGALAVFAATARPLHRRVQQRRHRPRRRRRRIGRRRDLDPSASKIDEADIGIAGSRPDRRRHRGARRTDRSRPRLVGELGTAGSATRQTAPGDLFERMRTGFSARPMSISRQSIARSMVRPPSGVSRSHVQARRALSLPHRQ